MKKFLDTSSILVWNEDLTDCVISSVTLEELEGIKSSANKDDAIKAQARQAVRAIERDKPEVIIYDKRLSDNLLNYQGFNSKVLENNDTKIIMCAYAYDDNWFHNCENDFVVFYSEDYLCRLLAKNFFDMQVASFREQNNNIEPYVGYKIIIPSDEELAGRLS